MNKTEKIKTKINFYKLLKTQATTEERKTEINKTIIKLKKALNQI